MMKLRNICACAMVLCWFGLFLTGCNKAVETGNKDEKAQLYIQVNMVGNTLSTKANDEIIEDPLLPNEKLHTLRIVIVRPDGEVEHNRYINLNDGGTSEFEGLEKTGYEAFKVAPNEVKRVYLFANEETYAGTETGKFDFSAYPAGSTDFESAVKNFELTGEVDGSKPLPQSSVYNLLVPGGVASSATNPIKKELTVVRAMTKFTFTFESSRPMKVTVDELEVGSVADKSYLLPHFYKDDGTKIDNSADYEISEKFWVNWLKETADKSHIVSQSDKLDFISNYNIPDRTSHAVLAKTGLDMDITTTISDTLVFYAHESKYIPAGASGQKYVINKLKIRDNNESSTNPTVMTFDASGSFKEALELVKVKSLFRNTHVMVRVIFTPGDLAIYARIMPWNDWVTEGTTPPYDKLIEIVD